MNLLHQIKEVKTVSEINEVNKLLDEGWIIIQVCQWHPTEELRFHLGFINHK